MSSLASRKSLALRVTLFLLALLAPLQASAAPASNAYPGQVAEIEVELPDLDSFTLRATVPVPPGTFHDGDTTLPVQFRDHDGSWVLTQVDIVTRYPDAARDGADVLEVQGRVSFPPGKQPGDRARYAVVRREHLPEPFSGERNPRRLLGRNQGVTLLSKDVFGNTYKADLLKDIRENSARVSKTHMGPLVNGWQTHRIMRPTVEVDGPQGTLPHFMGVHAFVKHWAGEEFITIDLRVHNGMCGRKDETQLDDALDDIYFEDLVLRVPDGWKVLHAFSDPFIGNDTVSDNWSMHPLIDPLDDGKMHILRTQGQLFRRLVLVPQGSAIDRARSYVRHENLGFVREGEDAGGRKFWSWFNDDTARYFPQRQRVPSLEHINMNPIRASLKSSLQDFQSHVAQGTGDNGWYPLTVEGQGYARPYGTPYGGMTGGVEIDLFAGIETAAVASVDGYRMHEIMARMYIDRQPTSLFDFDGEPTKVEDWLRLNNQNELFFPGLFNLRPLTPDHDPFGFGDAPVFQNEYVRAHGLTPDYEDVLLSFGAIDIQHWTRYTRNLKALTWLGNDGLAKSEIMMAAEIYRLTYHQYPNNANGNLIASWGLLGQMNHVNEHPGQGLGFGRASGWGLDITAAAYALGNRNLRDRYRPWFAMTTNLVEMGQSDCDGYLQAQPHHSNGAQYRQRQTFETNIGEHALKAMAETVFRGVDDDLAETLDEVIARQVYGTISPAFWSDEHHAPFSTVAVGPYDVDLPPFCGDAEDVWASNAYDGKYPWNSLGYAYEATGDILFLVRAAEMVGTTDLYTYFQNHATDDIDNRGTFLAYLQSLAED